MERAKKVIAVIVVMMLAAGLTACGGAAKISEKAYRQLMGDMGIDRLESMADNVTLSAVYRNKIDSAAYKDGQEYPSIWKELSEVCGEQKNYDQYGCYALGTDQEQAAAVLKEYESYLQEQGYVYLRTDSGFGDIYTKEKYAVMVKGVIGPVNWDDEVSGQYGMFIWFY